MLAEDPKIRRSEDPKIWQSAAIALFQWRPEMTQAKTVSFALFRAIAIGLLPLFVSLSSFADDRGRIDQLEKELQNVKGRLSKIEAALGGQAPNQKMALIGEGWKSITGWRQLRTNMTPDEVRKILGEPSRLDGGEISRWSYPNAGGVTFIKEKLYRWEEPRAD